MTTLPRRFDLYAFIHKGLRTLMADTLLAVGRLDTEDQPAVASVLLQLDTLLEVCASHLEHENEFVHAAMEQRAPGSSAHTGHDHGEHESAITWLRGLMRELEQTQGALRAEAAQRLYHALSCFVADNLLHMQVEEHHNNEVLWRHYNDAELQAIHQAIVTSIDPQTVAYMLGWMVRGLNPQERVQLLTGAASGMPPAEFDRLLDSLAGVLPGNEWRRLHAALSVPA